MTMCDKILSISKRRKKIYMQICVYNQPFHMHTHAQKPKQSVKSVCVCVFFLPFTIKFSELISNLMELII